MALELVDHGGEAVDNANLDLLELVDMVSIEALLSDIAVPEDNVPPDAIPGRLHEEGLPARHGYCCCYCCKRYLSQTFAADAVAFPEDDRTVSRNFFPVSCIARVLHQTVPVQQGTPDVEEPSS